MDENQQASVVQLHGDYASYGGHPESHHVLAGDISGLPDLAIFFSPDVSFGVRVLENQSGSRQLAEA